jgi:transcriptional regulator with XRE-family HTH domain
MATFPYNGQEIRRLRKELLFSREVLARYARVTVSTIDRLENNIPKRCDEKVLEGMAYALQCHPRDIAPEYVAPTLPYLPRVRYLPNMMRDKRAELGLTLEAVGKRAGLSLECIAKMEHKSSANRDSVRKVAKALGLPLHEFAPQYQSLYPTPQERALFPAEEFSRPEDALL